LKCGYNLGLAIKAAPFQRAEELKKKNGNWEKGRVDPKGIPLGTPGGKNGELPGGKRIIKRQQGKRGAGARIEEGGGI